MKLSYKDKPVTNETYLFRSLGSFWTQIFQDKEVIQGYTRGQAEEIIQRYYDLIEIVQNYSVKDTPILHKEKWKAIQLFKSKIDKAPFIFEDGKAIFGAQSEDDTYYRDITFRFGFDKVSSENVFQYFIGTEYKKFGLIADRVIAPTQLYVYGSDVVINDGLLSFNKNIFEDESLEKFDVVGEDGVPETYIDSDGIEQTEQSAILWIYNAEIDNDYLYSNFGYLFDLRLDNNETYQKILEVVFSLFVKGPTVRNIQTLCATGLNVPIVINDVEVVEQLFEDSLYNYVVTDKECYRVLKTSTLRSFKVGSSLFAGDLLTTDVEYYDNSVSANGWWKKTGLVDGKLAFSKYLFLGNYISQLTFSNEIEMITLNSSGNIVFPIIGHPDDVTKFNQFLNASAARKNALKTAFNLVSPGDQAVIIPLDFIMDNFLKLNVAFMKFVFASDVELSEFSKFIPLIRANLPPYIYLVLKLELAIPTDEYSNLNGELIEIDTTGDEDFVYLNADASDEDGYIAPYDTYTDLEARQFELGRALQEQPYELVGVDGVVDAEAEADGRRITVKAGQLLYTIPEGATTAVFNKLLFLDFS